MQFLESTTIDIPDSFWKYMAIHPVRRLCKLLPTFLVPLLYIHQEARQYPSSNQRRILKTGSFQTSRAWFSAVVPLEARSPGSSAGTSNPGARWRPAVFDAAVFCVCVDVVHSGRPVASLCYALLCWSSFLCTYRGEDRRAIKPPQNLRLVAPTPWGRERERERGKDTRTHAPIKRRDEINSCPFACWFGHPDWRGTFLLFYVEKAIKIAVHLSSREHSKAKKTSTRCDQTSHLVISINLF